MENINGIRYIDLFAGVGGFRYGIEQAYRWLEDERQADLGIWSQEVKGQHNTETRLSLPQRPSRLLGNSTRPECVYSNEWDKYANSVYRRHYGECDQRDIREVRADEIPDFDLLCGGFPCQAFSVAGKRGGFNDTRGTLFFEIARITSEKQPRLLLLENVKGLLNHDQGRTFRTILASLDELGYDAQWQVLNSKNFGVPQNRERIIIVGHLRGTPRPKVFPLPGTNPKTLKELTSNQSQGNRVYDPIGISTTLASQAGGLGAKTGLYAVNVEYVDEKREIGLDKVDIANTITATSYKGVNVANRNVVAVPVLTPDRPEKRQNGRRFKTNGEPSFTLTGQDIHGVMVNRKEGVKKDVDIAGTLSSSDWRGLNRNQDQTAVMQDLQIRRLTPIECERLQGFPDNWTQYGHDGKEISDTQRYKMMGNAVTTNVIQAVMEELL